MIIQKTCTPSSIFSGERFSVVYRIYGSEKDSRARETLGTLICDEPRSLSDFPDENKYAIVAQLFNHE